jgi:hypothetical protein
MGERRFEDIPRFAFAKKGEKVLILKTVMHALPAAGEDFEKALASSSCVISSAGHQIIAESLALNKPILVIPQKGQWEQRLNAEMIGATRKGMSTSLRRLGADLPAFLDRLESFRGTALPSRFDVSDNSAKIKRRIDKFLAAYCARKRGLAVDGPAAQAPIRQEAPDQGRAAG